MDTDNHRLKTENEELNRENNQLIKEINYIRNSNNLQVAQRTKMTEEIQTLKRRSAPTDYYRNLQASDYSEGTSRRYNY